jgi:hypothetical protein
MRYLITSDTNPPFLTKWYEYENHYTEGMTIYDFGHNKYTTNGIDWHDIDIDHL